MMTDIKGMKCKHSEQIAQLDKDLHDYNSKMMACKKGWQEVDESTIDSVKIDKELKNLCDFESMFVVTNIQL